MNEAVIWNYFKAKGLNDYGAAGLIGNLYAESGLNPQNLQNSCEKRLAMTDAEYAAAVDSGTYTNFVHDSAGWGLCQWTYWSRKQALLNFSHAAGKNIGDLGMQLDFLWKELSESYPGVLAGLRSATSALGASNLVLLNFERPADQSERVQKKRAEYGQKYYDQFSTHVEKGDMSMNTEWIQLIVSVLAGLATVIPLAIKLVEYVQKAVKEKNWGKVLDMVMKYMATAEKNLITVRTVRNGSSPWSKRPPRR